MTPRLLMTFDGAVRGEVPFERLELAIGRAPDNDLVIDDLAVSAHHARIVKIHSTFYIEDLGSTNGTFVNDVRVDEQALANGDRILIAGHQFVFDLDGKRDESVPGSDLDQTVVWSPRTAHSSPRVPKEAVLLVMSGRTSQATYHLTDSVVLVGSDAEAGVKLTGWFAPKRAGLFRRDHQGYSLYPGPDARDILRNHIPLTGPTLLNDGDLLDIAGVQLCFYLKENASERGSTELAR